MRSVGGIAAGGGRGADDRTSSRGEDLARCWRNDMRRGFDGLVALVSSHPDQDSLSGGGLVETCRPPAKVAPRNLRQTMDAILWRHQNGAKWRAVPEVLGPWWKAAQTFVQWSRLGVWEQLLFAVQNDRVELGMTFLDGTNIRAHQKAAGAPRNTTRPHNGTSVKRWVCLGAAWAPKLVITEAIGRAVAFVLTPRQDHELPHAIPTLNKLPEVPKWVVADRGYSSHAFREHIWNLENEW